MLFLPGSGQTAAENNVELIAEGFLGLRGLPIKLGNEAVTRCFIGGAVEDGIEREKRIAGEVHLRDKTGGKCGTEDGKVNVGGSPGVVVIAPGVGTRADGDEVVAALLISERVAATGEVGIERSVVLIHAVLIPAGGVGLPDFDESVRDRASVFVKDATADDNAFTERFGVMLAGKVERFGIHSGSRDGWACDFGKRMREVDERLGRSTFNGRNVRRVEVIGLGAGFRPTVSGNTGHEGDLQVSAFKDTAK